MTHDCHIIHMRWFFFKFDFRFVVDLGSTQDALWLQRFWSSTAGALRISGQASRRKRPATFRKHCRLNLWWGWGLSGSQSGKALTLVNFVLAISRARFTFCKIWSPRGHVGFPYKANLLCRFCKGLAGARRTWFHLIFWDFMTSWTSNTIKRIQPL